MGSAWRYSFNFGQCVLGISSVTGIVISHKLDSTQALP